MMQILFIYRKAQTLESIKELVLLADTNDLQKVF